MVRGSWFVVRGSWFVVFVDREWLAVIKKLETIGASGRKSMACSYL
jgi:hypothetical protein